MDWLNAETIAEIFKYIGYVLTGLCALMIMVVVHEFGHYIAGKLLGFKIKEFAIGFGPRIIKLQNKKNGEIFSVRPFPIGGFCQFYGEEEEDDGESSFNKQKPWKRLIVLIAGALFNLISAFVMITLVFTFYGQLLPTVQEVYEESYVGKNNILQVGDVVLKVNGKNVNIFMDGDLERAFSRIGADEEGTFTVLRGGKQINVTVKRSSIYLRDSSGNFIYDESSNPIVQNAFGITAGYEYVKLNFFTAFARSFSFGFYIIYKIFWLIGLLFRGQIGFAESVGGPVTLIATLSQSASAGFRSVMYVASVISLNLAVMNLLPLPALDGSKIVFTAFEGITKKPINKKIEGVIDTVGITVLFAFALFADALHFLQ